METKLKPIIILLTGKSGSGKSTAANAIKSHHTHLVKGDSVIYSLPKWCSDKNCLSVYHQYKRQCNDTHLENHLNVLATNLDEQYAEKFVQQLINSHYFETHKKVIVMEGYIFGLSHVKTELYNQLHDRFYIWEANRLGVV
jgi:dephospho-CoA kinase